VINGPVIEEAREKVAEGKGDWTYDVGLEPRNWRSPTDDERRRFEQARKSQRGSG
jgi:hypothetical protein